MTTELIFTAGRTAVVLRKLKTGQEVQRFDSGDKRKNFADAQQWVEDRRPEYDIGFLYKDEHGNPIA